PALAPEASPKSPPTGPHSIIGASLRVPDGTATEPFRPSVSEGHFRCLVLVCRRAVPRSGGPRRPARLRDFDAERLGRLQIDDELESGRQTGPASRPVSRP